MTARDIRLEKLKLLARHCKDSLPHDVGFCIMLLPLGSDKERMDYISNCERNDVRQMMRSLVAKWDTDEHFELKGGAKL